MWGGDLPLKHLMPAAEEKASLMAKLGLRAVVLDPEARIVAPRAPQPLPHPFTRVGDRIDLIEPADHGHLADALRDLRHKPPGWKTLMAVGQVLVVLMREDLDGTSAILAFVVDRHLESRVCPECLRAAFGFSEREAALAALVASGRPLGQVAQELGISVATARTHLRHIFLKAGIESQNELVVLVAASAFGTCSDLRHTAG